MPYTDQAKMTERFGAKELIALTDRATPPAGAIDAAILAKAIGDADAEVNSYVSGRYKVPLTETPVMIEVVASDIARFRLYAQRPTEEVRKRYETAVEWLRCVAKGTVRLLGATGLELDSAPEDIANAAPAVTTKTLAFGSDFVDRYQETPGS